MNLSLQKTFYKFLFLTVLLIGQLVVGQVSITSSPYSQNFTIGSSATASLPSGFKFGNNTTDWTAAGNVTATAAAAGTSGTGALTGSSSGNYYNFANGVTASSADRAIGVLTTGSFSSPRDVFFAFTNNTGSTVTSIDLTFDYEKYRTGTRAWDMTFFHGNTETNINTAATAGNQSYAADGANAVVNPPTTISKTVSLTGLSIPNGTTYYFRWRFAGNGGSTNSQGIGIDNISLTLTSAPSIVVPTVTTTSVSSITTSSASSGGNVTSDGGASVTDRGVAFGTAANPTTGTSDGTGTGTFTSSLTSLSLNTEYFYRAYATNSEGTSYGSELSFYTLAATPGAPVVNNPQLTTLDVTVNSSTENGNPSVTVYAIQETGGQYIQANGTLGATAVWQTAANWGTVTVTGLTASTNYTFQVKARNGANVETA
ncbi:MAG: fibronectin type III domain-containing protein, partial [Flavobacteriales bacterium]|nr:fibronectin type III domain-containing protein [Flavobacteriales bacterium]